MDIDDNIETIDEHIEKLEEPPRYKVIFLNDDFTPMDFVAQVIYNFFNKTEDESINLTYEIHNNGKAVVGIYPKDIAETKIYQVERLSQNSGYPLKCSIETDN